MKLVTITKMCLTEMYNRVRVGNNMSDMFSNRNGLKQDVLSPLLFNFALGYTIRRVQINQDGLELNVTHQLLVYVDDDVNIGRKRTYHKKKNTEALVVASKETGLEVNADKTKYMAMSLDQDAGWSHSIKIDNSFERVEEFK